MGDCHIEPTTEGMRIRGQCAEDFAMAFAEVFQTSATISREISGYVCVDPDTGKVDELGLYHVGTAKETQIPSLRSCSCDKTQVSFHTHPSSGISKFSSDDAGVGVSRINAGIEEGPCVIGLSDFLCLFGVKEAIKPSK